MVELPPAVEELNEFGRFAFLNEMHTMASQIMVYVKSDPRLSEQVKLAIEAIEGERKHLSRLFNDKYIRPESKNVVALIMRCAELYLQTGIWYEMSRANIRLANIDDRDGLLEDIKECFASPDLTDRYVISSPIIELTLTRIEMIHFFESEQYENYCGPEPYEHDPLSKFNFGHSESDDEIAMFNNCEIDKTFENIDDVICDDNDYLDAREKMSWAILRDLRFFGSVAVIIYYLVFLAITLDIAVNLWAHVSHTIAVCSGVCSIMIIIEIVSLRSCLVACFKPENDIGCIYPGLDLYVIEYVGQWFGGLGMLLAFLLEGRSDFTGVQFIFIAHHLLSLIWPLITQCLFFKKNQRVERVFKWPRIGFFTSCWWLFYRIISCILFPPSIPGIQTILYSMVRNSPSTKKAKEQRSLVAL